MLSSQECKPILQTFVFFIIPATIIFLYVTWKIGKKKAELIFSAKKRIVDSINSIDIHEKSIATSLKKVAILKVELEKTSTNNSTPTGFKKLEIEISNSLNEIGDEIYNYGKKIIGGAMVAASVLELFTENHLVGHALKHAGENIYAAKDSKSKKRKWISPQSSIEEDIASHLISINLSKNKIKEERLSIINDDEYLKSNKPNPEIEARKQCLLILLTAALSICFLLYLDHSLCNNKAH